MMARSQFPPIKIGGGAETGEQEHWLSPSSHMMTLEVEVWVVYGSTHYRIIASRCCLPPCGFQSLSSGRFFLFVFFLPNAFSHCDTCTMSSSRTEDSVGAYNYKTFTFLVRQESFCLLFYLFVKNSFF